MTPGHEIAGTIDTRGEQAEGFSKNDKVLVYPSIGEGLCPACRIGEENLCDKPRSLGVYVDGGYAEYVLGWFRGELRIDVIDESVRIALRSCWSILTHAIRSMKLIWTNARSPTIQEREWVEMLWGKQVATIFLNECYETLRNQEKDKNKKIYRKMSEEVACTIKEWGYGGLVKIYMKINTQYASVIEQYPIPLEILMRMIYPEFLRNLVAEK